MEYFQLIYNIVHKETDIHWYRVFCKPIFISSSLSNDENQMIYHSKLSDVITEGFQTPKKILHYKTAQTLECDQPLPACDIQPHIGVHW